MSEAEKLMKVRKDIKTRIEQVTVEIRILNIELVELKDQLARTNKELANG
jgi:septal ring factor EnvC (AmiA/AmiB activator)